MDTVTPKREGRPFTRAAGDGGRARVLITDDDPQVRDVLFALLSEQYECRAASSAEEALALVGAEEFQLVLSDIRMGGLSGLDMLPRLAELAPDTVIIMISGEQTIESAIRALRAGAFDYVTKPFDLEHVEAAVRRALEHHALRAAKGYYESFLEEIVHERTAELHRMNRTLHTLIEASPLAIFALDAAGRVKMCNPAAERAFGWGAQEIHDAPLSVLADGGAEQTWDGIASGEPAEGLETRCRRRDGAPADVNVWAAALGDEAAEPGGAAGRVVIVADVTERKKAEARINYLAYHDTLTGLPNRLLFEERLAQSLDGARREGRALAVMFVALDRFKQYNDTLGHAAGDQLLRAVGERLLRLAPEGGGALARFGGDEFSLLLTAAGGAACVAAAAREIQQILQPPFRVDGHELYVTVSIGIGLYPDDGEDAQSVLKNAGAALYRAKQQGGDNYQFYAADMNEHALKRLSLGNSLRRALESGEFVLHYQPQYGADASRVVGAEALVRWQHPELGLVPPAEFIPLAEDTGLIAPVGEWVLRTALAQNRSWQEAGLAPAPVSVNLSLRQFQQPDLLEVVSGALAESGLDPRYLELELTESSVMKDAARAVATLRELKGMGVSVAVDDFGSGYSSLSHLKHLPIDVLKIDKSFVRDMTEDPNDAAIVMAVVTLAHSLGLKVVAEGVETEEQLRFLRLLRCDAVQGYLLSRPLPAGDFERLLREGGRAGAGASFSAHKA